MAPGVLKREIVRAHVEGGGQRDVMVTYLKNPVARDMADFVGLLSVEVRDSFSFSGEALRAAVGSVREILGSPQSASVNVLLGQRKNLPKRVAEMVSRRATEVAGGALGPKQTTDFICTTVLQAVVDKST